MILVDLSQIMISTLMMQLKGKTADLDIDLLRHMVLNVLRSHRQKFKSKFGELVICCDSTNVWRKDEFPYYKAHRKTDRDASPLNWDKFFKQMNQVRDELQEFFPYKVIQVPRAEADDIIAVIVKMRHGKEDILILSGDKDFQQLQCYEDVYQYSPVLKKFINCDNPDLYLEEHILRGDPGDGVPNVLSADTVFIDRGRQTPMTTARIKKFLDAPDPTKEMSTAILRNYTRNRTMVDLNCIPAYISNAIEEQFNNPPGAKDRTQLFNYFIDRKLKNLMDAIGDF